MIIKNNKEFDLFKSKEFKAFKKEFPWFDVDTTIRIKLPKARIRESDIEHNRKQGVKIKPNATIFPIKESVMTTDGPVIWMYCETFEREPATGVIKNPNPPNIEMSDDMDIGYDKCELAFFMWMSKFCGNGPNFNQKQTNAGYVVEKAEEEAVDDIKERKIIARVESLIYNNEKENGLSDIEVAKLCIPFHVKLDEGNRPKGATELRKELIQAIEVRSYQRQGERVVNTMAGHKMFLTLYNNKEKAEGATLLVRAKSLGILKVRGMKSDGGKNQFWCIVDLATDKEVEKFGFHFKGQAVVDHDQFLQEDLKKNPELIEMIKAAVEREEAAPVV